MSLEAPSNEPMRLPASLHDVPAPRHRRVGLTTKIAPLHPDAMHAVLRAIEEIGQTFTATLRLEPVLERIIDESTDLAGGDGGSVMLLSEDRRELVVTAARGPRADIILGARQPADASIAGRAVREGPLILKGRVEQRAGSGSSHPREISRSLVMPLQVGGRLVGVLNINTETEREELPAASVNLLRILAN